MSKYEIKELIDSAMYGTFNLLSQVKFNISEDKKRVKNNIKFKDLHKGQRCFILGTGPSLREIDLSMLKNEIVFGVNYLYKGNIPSDLNINYYCLYDEHFYDESHIIETKEMFNKLNNTIFFVRTNASKVIDMNNMQKGNIYFQSCKLFQHKDLIRVDLTKNVTAPYNVILGCIQTAIYMGFSEIYLLGSDFNSFANIKIEHYYDDSLETSPVRENSIGYEMKYYAMVAYHHYALDKFSRDNGIRIYNATKNSLLDAYERKNLEDVLQKK